MQKLQTVNAETLLYEPLEKPSFVVDSLIPTGLSLFCGSQKIGNPDQSGRHRENLPEYPSVQGAERA